MEAVRIIKEMRAATNGEYPRFALWENVPGAFSSKKGEDFRIVLEEIIKIVEPTASMPDVPKNGWPCADSYRGDGWSIAYRVFDAQYWGVPQRRRRIHLVADFRGECAREVLFEREGVRGYFTQGGTPWDSLTAYAEGSVGADDCERAGEGIIGADLYNQTLTGDLSKAMTASACDADHVPCALVPYTLKIRSDGNVPCVMEVAGFKAGQGKNARGIGWESEIAPTLAGEAGGNSVPSVCVKTYDARGNGDGDTVNTITGDHETRITDYTSVVIEPVCYNGENITSPLNKADPKPGDPCHTLGTDSRNWLVEPVCCIDGDKIGKAERAGGSGLGIRSGDKMYTLTAYEDGTMPPLVARGPGAVAVRYIVRRLTPTECARLQGFADCWGEIDEKKDFTDEEYRFWLDVRNTHAEINGKAVKEYTKKQMLTWYNKLRTDSSEYKMWGNGIALPPALYCMQGIAEVLNSRQDITRL